MLSILLSCFLFLNNTSRQYFPVHILWWVNANTVYVEYQFIGEQVVVIFLTEPVTMATLLLVHSTFVSKAKSRVLFTSANVTMVTCLVKKMTRTYSPMIWYLTEKQGKVTGFYFNTYLPAAWRQYNYFVSLENSLRSTKPFRWVALFLVTCYYGNRQMMVWWFRQLLIRVKRWSQKMFQ